MQQAISKTEDDLFDTNDNSNDTCKYTNDTI